MADWKSVCRPGYFGRRRDAIQLGYDREYGPGNWRLAWVVDGIEYDFVGACKSLYEESYYLFLRDKPDDLDFICSFAECMDNAVSNIQCGLDYTIQEAYSCHIQDIAIRNVLNRLGRKFLGTKDELLIIRSSDSSGFRFGPGNVPFFAPELIPQPSKCPKWANEGSVEALWQSAKTLQVKR